MSGKNGFYNDPKMLKAVQDIQDYVKSKPVMEGPRTKSLKELRRQQQPR
jgi:hypothetical protein